MLCWVETKYTDRVGRNVMRLLWFTNTGPAFYHKWSWYAT